MGRMERIIICLVCVLFVLSYVVPVEAKSNEEIYQEKLAILKDDDVKGHYELGLWCIKNKLVEQAKIQFSKVIELDPKHKKARQDLDSVIQLEKDAKTSEIIKKYGPYKGVLDKPGADKEKLSWEKAREKETDHFIIKTNLSVDALNDICVLLECAYFNLQDLFGGFEQSQGKKLPVLVTKNQGEFRKICYDLTGINPPPDKGGVYIPPSESHSKQNYLLSFYRQQRPLLTFSLFHECTHYALRLAGPIPPRWLDEGWAVYYEASRLEGQKLVTNVNQDALRCIKNILTTQTYIKLKDFISIGSDEYDFAVCYQEGWSLVYFLLNGQKGKYKTGFLAYMEAWKKGKIVMCNDAKTDSLCPQDKPAHLKLFEECMGVPIDQLENEWKEYILELK